MKFLEEMSIVAEAVSKAFNADKMNYELLGNGNTHLHWHLFPRKEGDIENYGKERSFELFLRIDGFCLEGRRRHRRNGRVFNCKFLFAFLAFDPAPEILRFNFVDLFAMRTCCVHDYPLFVCFRYANIKETSNNVK